MIDDGLDGAYRRLAVAILVQAIRDAQARPWSDRHGPGSPKEAQRWLQSVEARALAAALDLENSLSRWLRQEMSTKVNRIGA